MIYENNYFKEEVSKSFMMTTGKKWKLVVYSGIVTVISFIISFMFRSLNNTIFDEVFFRFSGANSFSLLSIQKFVVIGFVLVYMWTYYKDMTFADIKTNRIYMLVKAGEKPKHIVAMKIASAYLLAIIVYFSSTIISLLSSILFGYPSSFIALPGLLISGVITILTLVSTVLFLSLFFRHSRWNFWIVFAYCIILALQSYFSGFSNVSSYSGKVASFSALFNFKETKGFLISLIVEFSFFSLFSVFYGRKLMNTFYTRKLSTKDLVIIDWKSETTIKEKKDYSELREKVYHGVLFGIVCAVFVLAFATNIFLVILGVNNLTSTTRVGKNVPVVFNSTTMEDSININDLVIFKVVDIDYEITEGDIVYFIDGETSQAVIMEVENISGINYTLDYSNYPDNVELGTYTRTMERSSIRGVYSWKSRSLGAWVTFNESSIGRIMMLGVPAFIVIFYDNIRKVTKAYKEMK